MREVPAIFQLTGPPQMLTMKTITNRVMRFHRNIPPEHSVSLRSNCWRMRPHSEMRCHEINQKREWKMYGIQILILKAATGSRVKPNIQRDLDVIPEKLLLFCFLVKVVSATKHF